MTWKDEEGHWSFTKDAAWATDKNNGAWDFTKQADKFSINVGDKIATSENPVWSAEHTGVPISKNHIPCGYWYDEPYVTPIEPFYYSSRPYPIDVVEALDSSGVALTEGILFTQQYAIYEDWPLEGVDSSGVSITAGRIGGSIKYIIPMEGIDSSGVSITAGALDEIVIYYEDWPVEGVDSLGVTISAGEHKDAILYTNWTMEGVDSSGVSITTGSLITP